MEDTKRTHTSGWVTFLKVIIITVSVIVGIILGFYLILRFGLGVDVIDIRKKIKLINAEVVESRLVTEPYTDSDAVDGLNALFGDNNIYVDNGEGYVFNEDAFNDASLASSEIILTAQQLASCTNLFLKNFANTSIDVSGIKFDADVKQLAFSDLTKEDDLVKVNVNAIMKFDFSYIKNEIKNVNNFLLNFVVKYIPNSIYLSANADFTVDTANENACIITPTTIKINNLSQEQSQEILDLLTSISTDESNLVTEVVNRFMNSIFSCSDGGLLSFLNISNFTFVEGENNQILIVLNAIENL